MGIGTAPAASALSWNVAGKSELAFYDIKAGKIAAGPRLPAEIVGERVIP